MKRTTIEKALITIYRKPNGNERTINESIHYGVKAYPYAYVSDLKKSGCKYTPSKNDLFGILKDRKEAKAFLSWIRKRDGYLVYD